MLVTGVTEPSRGVREGVDAAGGGRPNKIGGKELPMNLILVIIVGGILGWLASLIMRTDAQQGILLNVVVGLVGAFLAGLILSPLFGMPSILAGSFTLGALLISLLGAFILLAIEMGRASGRERVGIYG